MTKRSPKTPAKDTTRLAHAGRKAENTRGLVNTPVHRASTILFPTLAALREATRDPEQMSYARQGTPSTFALQDAIAEIEGGGGKTLVVPSGAAAITTTLLSVARPGGHLLVTDAVYSSTRLFCDDVLNPLGITTTYFDPTIGAEIGGLLRPETTAVFLESPGSLTFEMHDTPAILEAVKPRSDIVTIMDSTWATPLFFKPLEAGIDISIQALTKYIGGHSDLMMGSISAGGPMFKSLRKLVHRLGLYVSSDDAFLALRGLRTLAARLDRHQTTGFELARWLEARPEVSRVLHPGLESFPGHDLWKRDFSGASGLFSIVLKPGADVAAMMDGMGIFGMGYSWGGFESLALPLDLSFGRSAVPWNDPGPVVRLHAGLEDPGDLIADLEAGLARL